MEDSSNAENEPESIITVCELGPCPTIPEAANVASEPVPKRQSPRVWPPTRWGEWTYQPKEAASLDDEEESIEELISRGGRKVG